MDEEQNTEFKYIQDILGALLLAQGCFSRMDEDRAILLTCIDLLERKLVDMRQKRKVAVWCDESHQ